MWTLPSDGVWPLGSVVSPLGGVVTPAQTAALSTWLNLLTEWNAQIDLTAARSVDELLDLMLADAVILADRVTKGAKVIDVGSGAGAPGLALAILRPDLNVTLVEPLAKRVTFMQAVLAAIGRSDVAIERIKVAQLPKRKEGNRWDWAMARATLAPPAWLRAAGELVDIGGVATVFLAKAEPPVERGWSATTDRSYIWPGTGMSRRQVDYVKVR